MEGEDWKVTIQSEHTLETVADTPRKTITVTPATGGKGKSDDEAKAEAASKAKGKGKRDRSKSRSRDMTDPIPKPPMAPAARPPRGYVPPKPTPNLSGGVSYAVNGPIQGGPLPPSGGRGGVAFDTNGGGSGSGLRGPRSRHSSAESDNGQTYTMLIKQDSRDSYVNAPNPAICQVSYDSIYDDPYYHHY